ncbi:DUF1828 domain-containing protein [Pseudoxanthomonas sp. NC8]|nr:DUF1828 domain-containing protein [Pseudoxanthomonas sp. NC8]
MNHDAIKHALCGRYVPLTESSGYLESNWALPNDGTLIGAYVIAAGDDRVHLTDDGDVMFNAAAAGSDITPARAASYRKVAESFGVSLSENGAIGTTCLVQELPQTIARYVQAACAIANTSLKHRPQEEDERFERIVGALLSRQFGNRVTRRPELIGISGHQLRFPFAIDFNRERPVLIQTIGAEDGRLNWKVIHEAGGKIIDLKPLDRPYRFVAVLEAANDSEQASRYFADTADVVIYDGSPILRIAVG